MRRAMRKLQRDLSDATRGLLGDGRVEQWIYVDRPRLATYVEQIAGPSKKDWVPSLEGSVAISGPRVGGGATRQRRQFSDLEAISVLLKDISASGRLGFERPVGRFSHSGPRSREEGQKEWEARQRGDPLPADKPDHDFVIETMTATRLVFPMPENSWVRERLPGIAQMGVWVSDPTAAEAELNAAPDTHYDAPPVAGASYLYLIEAQWDSDGPFTGSVHLSGYTALEWLANDLRWAQIVGKEAAQEADLTGTDRVRSEFEQKTTNYRTAEPAFAFHDAEPQMPEAETTTGMSDFYAYQRGRHPAEILRGLGAIETAPRTIVSLYRPRLLTDKLHVNRDDGERQWWDLVAYPILVGARD